jgi:hypothetical protein
MLHIATTLELHSTDGKSITGLLTVQISTSNSTRGTDVAISNIRDDISLSGIGTSSGIGDFVMATSTVIVNVVEHPPTIPKILSNVVSKLHVFVQIVDKVSKVRSLTPFSSSLYLNRCFQVHPYASLAWQVMSSLYKV